MGSKFKALRALNVPLLSASLLKLTRLQEMQRCFVSQDFMGLKKDFKGFGGATGILVLLDFKALI